jgi:serine/threonine-protein kinase HipA
MGDYRLSPAYDLLNSRIHVEDHDFALEGGLLPANLAQGKIWAQFTTLAGQAPISEKIYNEMMVLMSSQSAKVEQLVAASFLNESTKRNYWQNFQGRLKQLVKV